MVIGYKTEASTGMGEIKPVDTALLFFWVISSIVEWYAWYACFDKLSLASKPHAPTFNRLPSTTINTIEHFSR